MESVSLSSVLILSPLNISKIACEIFYVELLYKCWPNALWSVLSLSCCVVGLPSNIMVLWVLMKTKETGSPSDIFIMNLAVMDFFFCLFMPLDNLNFFYLKSYLFNSASRFFLLFNLLGAPLFYCALCVERYLAVVWATKYTHFRNPQYRVGCCVALWVTTLSLSVSNALSQTDYICYFNVAIAFLYPTFAIIVFCNLSILKVLRMSSPGSDKVHPIKKQAHRTVSIILYFMIIVFCPILLLYPFHPFYTQEIYINFVLPLAFCLFSTSTCIHSLIYLYIVGKLSFIRDILNIKCTKEHPNGKNAEFA